MKNSKISEKSPKNVVKIILENRVYQTTEVYREDKLVSSECMLVKPTEQEMLKLFI